MDRLSLDEVDRRWVEVEAAVDATPAIDPWCSGPDWQIPVAEGFAPDADRLLLTTTTGRSTPTPSFALLSSTNDPGGTPIIAGLEPLWGFGSPLVGPDPGSLATDVAAVLATERRWRAVVLPGLPPLPHRPDGIDGPDATNSGGDSAPEVADASTPPADTTALSLAMALSSLGRAGFGHGITRLVIDLTGGVDAWLDRRSAKFRRNLRRARRRADDAGLTIVDASNDTDLFDRLVAIEQRSWKGRQGSGIVGQPMGTTYRLMIERLQARERILAHVATLGGNDVGYILGGVRGRRYRGLQLSYTDAGPEQSIGNVLQAHHLEVLAGGDLADLYDLGMDIDYKRRWADRAEPSLVLVVQR